MLACVYINHFFPNPPSPMNIRDFLVGGAGAGSKLADAGLALLRIFAGLAMAFAHGINKVPPSEGFTGLVESLGFPAPGLFAWLAGISEFFGGLLMAAGLLTRPAALMVLGTMFVAAFISHAGDPFGEREMALLFMFSALFFTMAGGGRYSIDAFLRDKQ